MRSLFLIILINITFQFIFAEVENNKTKIAKELLVEIKDELGNEITNAELKVTSHDNILNTKSFKPNGKGVISIPTEDFGYANVYWHIKHSTLANQAGAYLDLDDYKDKPYNIKLTSGPGLRGRVVDEKGKGVVGAKISLHKELRTDGAFFDFKQLDVAYSTHKGEYNFPSLAKSKYYLEAEYKNSKTFKTIEVKHPASGNINLQLQPGKRVKLKVFDEKGRKVEVYSFNALVTKKKIRAIGYDYEEDQFQKIERSKHEVEFLVPNNNYLHLDFYDDKYEGQQVFNIELKDNIELKVTLVSLIRVKGRFVDEASGTPVPDVEINFNTLDNTGEYEDYYTEGGSNDKGVYEFYLGRDIEYFMYTYAKNYLNGERTSIKVRQKDIEIPDIKLRKGESFSIKLFEKSSTLKNTQIIKNKKISVSIENDDMRKGRYTFKSDSDGEIVVGGLSNGDNLTLSTEDHIASIIEYRGQRDVSDIVLNKSGKIILKVVDENNKSIPKVSFKSLNKEYEYYGEGWYGVQYKEKDQVYLVEELAAGLQQFSVEVGNKWLTEKLYTVKVFSGQTVKKTIVLKRAPHIRIQLDDEISKKVKSMKVYLYSSLNGSIDSILVNREEGSNLYKLPIDKNHIIAFMVKVKGYLPTQKMAVSANEKDGMVYKLKLKEGLKLEGKVLNEKGEPIKEAVIEIERVGGRSSRFRERGGSEADGSYRLSALTPGTYRLEVRKDGYTEYTNIIKLKDSITNQNIKLNKGFSINGKVLSKSGEIIKNVYVQISKKKGDYFSHHGLSDGSYDNYTGEDGLYYFNNLTEGIYQLDVVSKKYGFAESEPIEFNNNSELVIHKNLYMVEGEEISGRVVDENGNPVAGIELYNYSPDGKGSEEIGVVSDKDGFFRFYPLIKGQYNIEASNENYFQEEEAEEILYQTGDKNVEIKVKKETLIEGEIVTPDERKLHNYRIYFIPAKKGYRRSLYPKEKNGNKFKLSLEDLLEHIPENNRFRIQVEADGYNPGVSKTMSKEDLFNGTIVVELKQEKTAQLQVQNLSGERLADIEVECEKESQNSDNYDDFSISEIFRGIANETTNENGLVELKGIVKGDYVIKINSTSYAPLTKTIHLDPDSGSIVNITLIKGGSIKGKVYNENREALLGETVRLEPINKDNSSSKRAIVSITNVEGEYFMKNIPMGVYRLFIAEEVKSNPRLQKNNREIEIEIQNDQEFIQDILKESQKKYKGKISAKIVGSDGEFSNAYLMKVGSERPIKEASVVNFHFEMEHIPDGEYILFVRNISTLDMLKKELSIQNGEHVEVEFHPPSLIVQARVVNENGDAVKGETAFLIRRPSEKIQQVDELFKYLETTSKVIDGRLKMKVQKVGDYKLVIGLSQSHVGYLVEDISLEEGEFKDLGTLTLNKGIELKGTVLDENAKPIPYARFVTKFNGLPMENYEWRTNENGKCYVDGIQSLPCEITVYAYGYITKKLKVNFKEFEIQLEKARKISVELEGSKKTLRLVELCHENGTNLNLNEPGRYDNDYKKRSDKEGRLTFENIKPGFYKVKVYPRNKQNEPYLSDIIEVRKGEDASVSIPLYD